MDTKDDNSGTLLLREAAKNGYETVVKLLLEMGAVGVDLKDSVG